MGRHCESASISRRFPSRVVPRPPMIGLNHFPGSFPIRVSSVHNRAGCERKFASVEHAIKHRVVNHAFNFNPSVTHRGTQRIDDAPVNQCCVLAACHACESQFIASPKPAFSNTNSHSSRDFRTFAGGAHDSFLWKLASHRVFSCASAAAVTFAARQRSAAVTFAASLSGRDAIDATTMSCITWARCLRGVRSRIARSCSNFMESPLFVAPGDTHRQLNCATAEPGIGVSHAVQSEISHLLNAPLECGHA